MTRWLRPVKQQLKAFLRRAAQATPPPQLAASHWGLEDAGDGRLALHGVHLDALLRKWGSPLFVIDADALERQSARFTSAGACEVFVSYKTNPVPFVLQTLHSAGVGAEVISAYELWLAGELGVPMNRVVYNGPVKSPLSISAAIAGDIALLTANHAEELAVFSRLARAAGKRPRTGIRVSTDVGWSAQFGVPISGGAAMRAFSGAMADSALDVCGLHAHRGGMIRTEGELTSFVLDILRFADDLADALRLDLDVIDFGGSLATPAVDGLRPLHKRMNRTLLRDLPAPDVSAALTIESYVSLVAEMVDHHYVQRGRPRPRIFLEPGRALTSSAQLLLASVASLKEAPDRVYAILDAGVNIAESVRNEYHQLLAVTHAGREAKQIYTVVGPICTPGDTLYPAIKLPRLAVGDVVAIMDAGAYFVPFSTSFSFPQPAIVALRQGNDVLVRRAEDFADLIRRDALTGGTAAALPEANSAQDLGCGAFVAPED